MTFRPGRRQFKSCRFGAVVIVFLAVSLGIGLFTFIHWRFNRPPFDLELLDPLQTGMSKSDVAAILGSPKENQYGQETWAYSREHAWPIVYIYFERSGTYRNFEYDH